jgi:phospholipid/cholesterol/gamma-HCH transport system substrate-binding protein
MRRGAALRLAAALTAATVVTSGCGVLSGGLRGVDLPGGANLGESPYQVTAEFSDVLDLVPQSLVKVNDVAVGSVTDIELTDDWTAKVTMLVNDSVRVPAEALARIRTTSLLGEKYVELAAPDDIAGPGEVQALLQEGANIPLSRTNSAAEVEEVLGALSMLLNGGGLAQIRTIAIELNAALEGNEPEIRVLLDDLDQLVGALDDRKLEITRALDEINRLGATLADRRGQIEVALDDLGPGLAELEAQRTQFVDMLQALDRLSTVSTDVINQSRDDALADLALLKPILENLAAAGDDLPNALEIFFTPPFTDAAVDAFAGDYANLYVRLDLDLASVLENLRRSNQPFPGPDGPLADLPPTGQLLGPLLSGLPPLTEFPLPGELPAPPLPAPQVAPPPLEQGPVGPPPASPPSRPGTPPGMLGPLLGGGL